MAESHELQQSTSSIGFAHGSSGFTVNPLSVRTPRVSLVSNATTSTYVPLSNSVASVRLPVPDDQHSQNGLVINEDDLDSVIDIRTGMAPPKPPVVRAEDVWREIVKSSNGRDKALKLIQYSFKLCTLFHNNVTASPLLRRGRAQPKWETDIVVGVDQTISGLSLARKCLILFNWLTPLSQITHPQPVEAFSALHNKFGKRPNAQQQPPLLHKFLHAPPPVLLDLLNGAADDVATFSKLGIINKRVGSRAAKIADWCWFVATLVKLVELQVERGILSSMIRDVESRLYRESMAGPGKPSEGAKIDDGELQKLRKQDYWLQIARGKLLLDLVFVSYEVFNLKRAQTTVKAVTGLLSAVLSSYKLYDQHTHALIKSGHS
ncbi:hypothetical protein EXIGLDRAFT_599272 [Exidia glandulosa HHB12029]|uniref:Uncharacterized protein n=1 Tax=Exidia glandulosa HHB12029 TaxID=1314781 RepID=A0A166BTG3_EXIGL|nr:hypothetical protein EXIGLDRAFT_599272 [Exidia glandulosa HHB12029]